MSPGKQTEEVDALRDQLAQLESELASERQRVHAAENRFRRLVDASPVMVWMSGPDTLCTYFNRAWLEFHGRAIEAELGNGWADGLHPDDRDLCLETYVRSFAARQPFRVQYRLHRGGGEYTWIEHVGSPFFEPDSQFAGYIGTAVDITDRKRALFTPDENSVRLVFALTERERQVLVLIAEGKSTKEAAAQLGISYKTADSHRSRILEKLGVHETASMVRYAIRAGLIAP
jgi:PAS domain S-box-containing protein